MGKIYKNGILFAGSTDHAKSVAFDNTDTGLEADNVQEAIEEVKNDVAEINSNLIPQDITNRITTTENANLYSGTHAYITNYQVLAYLYFNHITVNAHTDIEIGHIGIAPLKQISTICIFVDVSNNKILSYGQLVVSTSGKIKVKSYADVESARCICLLSYVTN